MILIKVLNPKMATKLSNLGFSFSKEKFNGKDIFVFVQSDELLRELNKNFSSSKGDYFVDKLMLFKKGG